MTASELADDLDRLAETLDSHQPFTAATLRQASARLRQVELMKGALAEIKTLLSAARNDGKSAAVRESNVNAAWHTADDALALTGEAQ